MKSAEIREKYLKFFEEKGCKRMASSSLIPDDPSMLLTSAGMVQFKPYFLQQKQLEEPFIGTTTCQKCLRTSDIENIGITGRHLSFFEMLGNFSFGKYFKKEMCAWALEFSTDVLEFPLEKLYFSVYEEDDEAIEIWKSLGVPSDRIVKLGADDNFWTAGPTGPCGPCSELYYDQGPEHGCGKPDCAPGCDCDRFIEYWNCVFTQYDRQEDGTLVPLPKKNIDTGMGLERVAALTQGVYTNYESDILRSLIELGEKVTGRVYGQDKVTDKALRIMADHSRATTFMIADGILPGNEGREYVLRRLLRRAVRYGYLMGVEKPFMVEFVDAVNEMMGHAYPEVPENIELIRGVVAAEEASFRATLVRGQAYLDEAIEALEGTELSGDAAFKLHDTYGFPIDITEEICNERGLTVDRARFDVLMEEQRQRGRAAAKDDAWGMYGGVYSELANDIAATEFVGYEADACEATVVAIVANGERVDAATPASGEVELFLDKTTFYGEMGGQVGDTGTIADGSMSFAVADTKIPEKGIYAHKGHVVDGEVKVGDAVCASIDHARRERIRRNHTATHILDWALRSVLGEHVKQAGSLVAPDRLRFDFTHFEGMTREQIAEVEALCNEKIMEDGKVNYYETSLEEARKAGVIALFGEKYGDVVRVLETGDYSKELCGGTHVHRTAEIGFMKIVSESSVAANTRRIEAVTSYDALAYVNSQLDVLAEAAAAAKATPATLVQRVSADVAKIKELEKAVKEAKKAGAGDELGKMVASRQDIPAPCKAELLLFEGAEMNDLKAFWDDAKAKAQDAYAVVCASKTPAGGVALLAAGNDAAAEAGFDAGKVIKAIAPLVDGRGGGKAKMAQAGGKDQAGIAKIADALAELA